MKAILTAEQACINYAIAVSEVRRRTCFLRDNVCPNWSPQESPDYQCNYPGCPESPSCLTEYFTGVKDASYGTDGVAQDMPDPSDLCDVCKAKLAAIEERREWKRKLGAAKRSIERLGKRLNGKEAR